MVYTCFSPGEAALPEGMVFYGRALKSIRAALLGQSLNFRLSELLYRLKRYNFENRTCQPFSAIFGTNSELYPTDNNPPRNMRLNSNVMFCVNVVKFKIPIQNIT